MDQAPILDRGTSPVLRNYISLNKKKTTFCSLAASVLLTSAPALASDYSGLFYAFLIVYGGLGLLCGFSSGFVCQVVLAERKRKASWAAINLTAPIATTIGLIATISIDPQSFSAMAWITGGISAVGTAIAAIATASLRDT